MYVAWLRSLLRAPSPTRNLPIRRGVRLAPTLLEARDVPTLYTVTLADPDGTYGDAAAIHTGEFLATDAAVEAADPAEAVSLALTGQFTVTLTWAGGTATRNYQMREGGVSRVGTDPAAQLPFLLVDQGGGSYQIRMEDKAKFSNPDWDYDDHYWDVTVEEVTSPSILGQVWIDDDRDGLQSEGEGAFRGGVWVSLLESDGTLVDRTFTDMAGRYSFLDITPGTGYKIKFDLPDWFIFSQNQLAGDPALDSDVDGGGTTGIVFVGNGDIKANVDAGLEVAGGEAPDPIPRETPAEEAPPPRPLWTKADAIQLLNQSAVGRRTLDILNRADVEVRSSEKIQVQVRVRENGVWGAFGPKDWGGMTERTPTKKIIHIPKNYTSAAAAALILVHEASHADGGDEFAAYKAETQFVIESTDENVKKLARPGLIKKVGATETVNEDRVKAFVEDSYKGWYTPNPNVEYKRGGNGQIIIEYGTETVVTGWRP